MKAKVVYLSTGLEAGAARELSRRLAHATSRDMARGMFFTGVLQTTRDVGGPDMEAECRRRLPPDHRYVDFFNYSIEDFLRLSFTAARLLGPLCNGFQGAHWLLGQQATATFLDSLAGRIMLTLAHNDPHRMFTLLPNAFRTAVSYGERTVTWTGERRGVLVMRRDFMPPSYQEGVLQAVLEACGARDVAVSGRQTGPVDAEYSMSWS